MSLMMESPTAALTVKETARELRISRCHLYDLFGDGTIRRVKLGSKVLVPRSEIERILAGDERKAS